jgi:hypothetical protein
VTKRKFKILSSRGFAPDHGESWANALVHRDYTRLGTVHVRLENDGLTISNW